MENLVYKYNDVYAVVNKMDKIIAIMDNFDDAYKYAEKMGCLCVETWKNFDGSIGEVSDVFWLEDRNKFNFLKQKFLALFMIIISLVSIPLFDGDITFAVFLSPMMLYLLFTKEYWLQ